MDSLRASLTSCLLSESVPIRDGSGVGGFGGGALHDAPHGDGSLNFDDGIDYQGDFGASDGDDSHSIDPVKGENLPDSRKCRAD